MRTPEQIVEDMRREIDRERQLHGTLYEGSALLGAVARAIARECARAKLEAVESNPEGDTPSPIERSPMRIVTADDLPREAPLRSDGARHSDCTNCGGQSATGGVFPPCEACGSTGDRVVQLEREAAALRAIVAGVASEHPQSLCFSGDGTWRCFYCGCRMQAGADAAAMHARDCLHRRATDALASGDHRNCVHDVTAAATECSACGDCRVCQGSCLGCGVSR